MAAFEDSYKSQLQGVSQQVARERLDGQVTTQDNMLSDTVTNLRRRPGAQYAYSVAMATATDQSMVAWDTDIAGERCQVLLDIVSGDVVVLDAEYATLATLNSPYLVATKVQDIQAAAVGDEFFLANTKQQPTTGAITTDTDPQRRGYIVIKAGAFSKKYDVTVTQTTGPVLTYTASYTTPDGTAVGDAAVSTPAYIAAQLATAINAVPLLNINASNIVGDPEVYFEGVASVINLVVSSSSGTSTVAVSGASFIKDAADLPARFGHPAADGYIMRVGDYTSSKFYRYDFTKVAWLESGSYTAPLTLTNTPISITKVGAVWSIDSSPFEGRFAGDETTNPDPAFVSRGITGISAYQGRLVILAGAQVCMSASLKARRFYRSTLTSLLDADTIGIAAAGASSAAWVHAVEFSKDLLLFSAKYQGVVPGANTAVTPRTASVVVMTNYSADTNARPVLTGSSVMYSTPRSADYFGIMEMLPSNTTDASYNSYDSTAHLPEYMAGLCRFAVAHSSANMVLVAPSDSHTTLIVHEYIWEGDKKVQQAWHRWTFKYPVAAAYFAGSAMHVVFVRNGMVVGCTIDPRSRPTGASVYRAPFDMRSQLTVAANLAVVPMWLRVFAPDAVADLKMCVSTGDLSGDEVGFTVGGFNLHTVDDFPAGQVNLGFPFVSTFEPTPPMKKDSNGVKVSSNKATVVKFMVGTSGSREFNVSISDEHPSDYDAAVPVSPLYYTSTELQLGSGQVGGPNSVVIVPARTLADSTKLVLSTDGTGELNLVSLEYTMKYREKVQRAKH